MPSMARFKRSFPNFASSFMHICRPCNSHGQDIVFQSPASDLSQQESDMIIAVTEWSLGMANSLVTSLWSIPLSSCLCNIWHDLVIQVKSKGNLWLRRISAARAARSSLPNWNVQLLLSLIGLRCHADWFQTLIPWCMQKLSSTLHGNLSFVKTASHSRSDISSVYQLNLNFL